ncbi:MAG: hypothetical protein DRQ13_03245 [Ignavibacteriae bacterium]|nr:MAG: hypothetical protein DRQ13_03245 [Ignavibacteriota bacterium]
MKRIIPIFFFLILVFFFNSCERKEYTEEGIKEIVEEINVKLEKAVGEEFNWGSPEAYSLFRAYFSEDGKLMFINESYTYRKPAESFNRYYIKDGNLLHIISRKMEYISDKKSGKGKKMMINIEFYSDPDENILLYDKIVNKERVTLNDDEAEEIFRHVDELKEIVNKREIIQ